MTAAGEKEFDALMLKIASNPINIFLDFNAVIVNLASLPPEGQKNILAEAIETWIASLKKDTGATTI